MENATTGYSGPCWGLRYAYSNRLNYVPAHSPSIVVTAFVHDGIYEYWRATGNEEARQALRASCEFVLRDLARSTDDDGLCFSYTTTKQDRVLNANALGAAMLARTYSITREVELRDLASEAMRWTVAQQRTDGWWPYRLYDNGTEMTQTDFHQGFMIETLQDYLLHTEDDEPPLRDAIRRGTEFYYDHQFQPDGRSLARLPHKYPIDIHYQAQGIITFTRMRLLQPHYAQFAQQIADWTIEHMQDAEGYFYYQVHRRHTNKTSFIRWGQAWMMKALACLEARPL
jgi:rhamnogalacturonyl hydrolase YesR